jgi:hypothetical protein
MAPKRTSPSTATCAAPLEATGSTETSAPATVIPTGVLNAIELGFTELSALANLLNCLAASAVLLEPDALYPIERSLRDTTTRIEGAWQAAWDARRTAGAAR